MKILLQNVQNKFYFCIVDIWTSSPRRAYDFRHFERALEFVRKQNL